MRASMGVSIGVSMSSVGVLAAGLMAAVVVPAAGQVLPITYQGRLEFAGAPVNGPHDFRFSVYDAPQNGNLLALPPCYDDLQVKDGVFTAVVFFTDPSVLDGRELWLEVQVRPGVEGNCGGNYTTLTPRQLIMATPYAGFSNATRGVFANNGESFVSVGGRQTPISISEQFGVHRPTAGFGGMYVSTNTGGEPFYGYAANGAPLAYHYIDGNSGDWNLIAANKLRLAVEGNGGTRFYNSTSQPSVEITNEQGRSLFRRWNPEGTLGDVGMSFDVFNGDTYLRVPGRVAVNTVDPAAQMEIEASSKTAMILNRTGSDGVVMQIDNDGVAAGSISVSGSTVSYNAFSGSHYARVADADKVPGRGLLLTMTGDNVRMNGLEDGETVHGVEVSSVTNDPAVIGVSNGLLEAGKPMSEQNPLLAAAEGNGDLWVVDDGRGDIKPGDLLISSDTPGHAMLDDAARFETGHVVARAAGRVRWETVTASGDGKRRAKLAVLFDRSTRSGRPQIGSTTARASRSER